MTPAFPAPRDGGVTAAELAQLRAPFAPADIEWRVQQAGEKNGRPWARVLAYVTNRAIMERLDAVAGPHRWRNDYAEGPAGGVVCTIGILCQVTEDRTEWVAKKDGAENTDVEPVKGGLSGAMKRAAVQWGIGRYLYDLTEGWAKVHDGGRFSARTKDGTWFKWDPPDLPEWAVPAPKLATRAQLEELVALAQGLADEKVRKAVARRLVDGMTVEAAAEAHAFITARLAPAAASA